MSIIYDALKKVEQSGVKDTKPQDFGNVHSKYKFKTYLLYALVACAGLFTVNIFFVFLTHSNKISGANNTGPSEVKVQAKQVLAKEASHQNKVSPPAQQAASSDSPVRMSSRGLLILNGIFFSGDERYALVNNHIVKEGDVVNGATVKRITVDEVEAEVDGAILILTTAQR